MDLNFMENNNDNNNHKKRFNLKKQLRRIDLRVFVLLLVTLLASFIFFTGRDFLQYQIIKQSKLQKVFSNNIKQVDIVSSELLFFDQLKDKDLEAKLKQQQLLESFASGNINVLLKKIVKVLPTYKLVLVSLTHGDILKIEDDFYKVSVQMVLKGTYSSLGEYLFCLDDLPFLYQFEEVNLKSKDLRGEILEMSLDLQVWYK
jgi:hypothetical protein